MRQNRHYLFDMSYLEVCGVLTWVAVEVPKFCGVGAGAGVLKRGAGVESESEKGDSAPLCPVEQGLGTCSLTLTFDMALIRIFVTQVRVQHGV